MLTVQYIIDSNISTDPQTFDGVTEPKIKDLISRNITNILTRKNWKPRNEWELYT